MPVYPHDCRKGSLAFCPTESGIMGGLKSGELKPAPSWQSLAGLLGECASQEVAKNSFSRSVGVVFKLSHRTTPRLDIKYFTAAWAVCRQRWRKWCCYPAKTLHVLKMNANKQTVLVNVHLMSRFSVFCIFFSSVGWQWALEMWATNRKHDYSCFSDQKIHFLFCFHLMIGSEFPIMALCFTLRDFHQ